MNKPNCNLLLVCDQVILSKDNKISLIGIFDQIFVSNFPSHHPRLSLVGNITGEAYSDHVLTVVVADSAGKKLLPDQNISLNLGIAGRSNLVAEFINLPITMAGSITFSLLFKQIELAKTVLTVSHISQPSPKSKVIN